jgi:hypothetical protein
VVPVAQACSSSMFASADGLFDFEVTGES